MWTRSYPRFTLQINKWQYLEINPTDWACAGAAELMARRDEEEQRWKQCYDTDVLLTTMNIRNKLNISYDSQCYV